MQRPRRTTARPPLPPASTEEQKPPKAGLPRIVVGLGITRRALALVAVVAFLMLSYATSMKIYLSQSNDIATAKQQIAQRRANIDRITDEIARWDDPDYVRAQARDRLGWVVPGEVGYRVVGPDGRVISGQVTTIGKAYAETQTWYEKMWGSVQTADMPAPAATPKPVETITAPTPSPAASKR